MRFIFTNDEILYIKQRYNFKGLIGINSDSQIVPDMEESLIKSGIILTGRRNNELKTEIRFLFSAWEKMRYSVISPECTDEEHMQLILTEGKNILVIEQNENKYTIDIFDYRYNEMDNLFCKVAGLNPIISSEISMNITLEIEDLERLLDGDRDETSHTLEISTGISANTFLEFAHIISGDASEVNSIRFVLVEDHLQDSGALCRIVSSNKGIYALKHITFPEGEKMVLLIGNAKNIVDSLYVIN